MLRSLQVFARKLPKNHRSENLPLFQNIPSRVSINGIKKRPLNFSIGEYLKLSKHKLSLFVSLTALAGCGITATKIDSHRVAAAFFGTLLTSFSACSLNQIYEVNQDSKMKRTFTRPLLSGKMSLKSASIWAYSSGMAGFIILAHFCGKVPSLLSMSNIILYVLIYTPAKMKTSWNTSIGAIVGAIPPLIGYSSCSNILEDVPRAFFLPICMYLWQLPHINSLSWMLKNDYKNAGYVMSSLVNPSFCGFSSFTAAYSLSLISKISIYYGFFQNSYMLWMLIPNSLFTGFAWIFYITKASSKTLFMLSLIYIPIMISVVLLLSQNKYQLL